MKIDKLLIKDFKWFLVKENILVNFCYFLWFRIVGIQDEQRNNQYKTSSILTKQELKKTKIYQKSRSFFYVSGYTSGSTNAPLKVYRSFFNVVFEEYTIKSFLFKIGISLRPKIAVLRGDHIKDANDMDGPYWRRMPFTNKLLLSSFHLSNHSIPQYLKALENYKPELIMAYPSSILALSKIAIQQGWKPDWGLKAVFTSSESFSDNDQTIVRSVFPLLYDHYGQAERVAALQQCQLGNYHVREDYSLVEFLEESHGIKIIGTSDRNKAMKLIRYDTGDFVEGIGTGLCGCGLKSRFVKKIIGREDDYIELNNGRTVSRLSVVFRDIPYLIECQVVQDKKNHLILRYVASGDEYILRVVEQTIDSELRKKIGNEIEIEFENVKVIERSKSGKFKSVINTYSKGI